MSATGHHYGGVKPAVFAIVVAAASALLLTGCVTAVPTPMAPSDEDAASRNQRMLDLTYDGLKLEGVMRRLTTSQTHADGTADALFACMADAGLGDVGISYGTDQGYGLASNDGSTINSTRDKVAFYRCVAEYPSGFGSDETALSASEAAYLTDYWARWIVPCLARTGHVVFETTDAPLFGFSPYDRISYRADEAADFDSNGYPDERAELIAQCGEPYGLITRLGG
jgi:hypothetical protein